jgi:hypothetical protein
MTLTEWTDAIIADLKAAGFEASVHQGFPLAKTPVTHDEKYRFLKFRSHSFCRSNDLCRRSSVQAYQRDRVPRRKDWRRIRVDDMESQAIFESFVSTVCPECGATKRKRNAFCLPCYRQLPRALKSSLWKRFGSGFEEAYQACLSWFRLHPFQGVHRAKQKSFFEEET